MASGLKKSQVGFENIYVIGGKDKYLSDAECERLVEKLLSEQERAMSLYQVRGNEADAADVLDELRTMPFLSAKRVVVVREADKFISENREVLEKYFDEPSRTGVLILTVQTWRKNTKLSKKLSNVGKFVEVGAMKAWQLPKYVANYAKTKCGKAMSEMTAGLLVELAGDEAGAACREVEKLAVYVGEKKTIKSEDVEALTGHNRMFGAFEVIDTVMAGDTGQAIARLRNMFDTDKDAEYRIVGAFAFHFRRMFRAKVMLGGSTVIVTDNVRIECDTLTDNQVPEGSSMTATDDVRVKFVGTGRMQFKGNSKFVVNKGAFVGIESFEECEIFDTALRFELNEYAKIFK